jgi:hypothetical protein
VYGGINVDLSSLLLALLHELSNVLTLIGTSKYSNDSMSRWRDSLSASIKTAELVTIFNLEQLGSQDVCTKMLKHVT